MNRSVLDNHGRHEIEGLGEGSLPPVRREGPARVLFLSAQTHGLKSNGIEMMHATEGRSDVDWVHVRMTPTPWMKKVMATVRFSDGKWDLSQTRRRFAWSRLLRGWLREQLPLERFDAIHVITRVHCAGVAAELERADPDRRVVLAVSVDTTAVGDRREFAPDVRQSRLDELAERKMYRRMDMVQCRSRWAQRSVVDDYGMEEVRTVVAPPSPGAPVRVREPFGGDTERPIRIGMCGNPWSRKGGPRLWRWFRERWRGRAELRVVCRDAGFLAGEEGVVWESQMPREELFERFYPELDVLVLPAHRDQTPWVLAEAASCGVCCVGPDQCGVPDMVRHGETGLLCHRDDEACFVESVEKLLGDRDLIDRMGAAAAEHAAANLRREQNYPRVIDKLVELVDERA